MLGVGEMDELTVRQQLKRAKEILAHVACRCDEGEMRCAEFYSERGCKGWAARIFLRHPYPYPFETSSQKERHKLYKT